MHAALSYNLPVSSPQSGAADSLYASARKRGQRGQLWASLTGSARSLRALAEVGEACSIQAKAAGGLHTVALSQIQGSESRSADFDRDFNPLQDCTQERWLGIAAARQRDRQLPPVALIQVGDIYFVRDGHHRISVARALGQKAIQATVEVWHVAGQLPWQESSPPPRRQRARHAVHARMRSNGSAVASILGWLSAALRPPDRATATQRAA
jgi:hypothetical protein